MKVIKKITFSIVFLCFASNNTVQLSLRDGVSLLNVGSWFATIIGAGCLAQNMHLNHLMNKKGSKSAWVGDEEKMLVHSYWHKLSLVTMASGILYLLTFPATSPAGSLRNLFRYPAIIGTGCFLENWYLKRQVEQLGKLTTSQEKLLDIYWGWMASCVIGTGVVYLLASQDRLEAFRMILSGMTKGLEKSIS